MNPDNLYKMWYQSNNPGGEIVVINGNLMAKSRDSSSYQDIKQDRVYMRINSCIEQRTRSKSLLFACSCGICSSYLMTELYKNIILKNNESLMNEQLINEQRINEQLINEQRINEQLMNECLNEVLTKQVVDPLPVNTTKAKPVNTTKTQPSNNQDNNIITFGKYKNRTYTDIFKSDREYCVWCVECLAINRSKEEMINKNILLFVRYIKRCIYTL